MFGDHWNALVVFLLWSALIVIMALTMCTCSKHAEKRSVLFTFYYFNICFLFLFFINEMERNTCCNMFNHLNSYWWIMMAQFVVFIFLIIILTYLMITISLDISFFSPAVNDLKNYQTWPSDGQSSTLTNSTSEWGSVNSSE